MRLIRYDAASGEITGRQDVWPPREDWLRAPPPGTILAPAGASVPTAATHYVADGALRAYTAAQAAAKAARPSLAARWSNVAFEWADPRALAALREEARARITAAWRAATAAPVVYAGHPVAVDGASREDLDATNAEVLALGAMPADWPGGWKATDDAYVPIPDAAAWREFYVALAAARRAHFHRAQALKAAIDAATTAAEVAAIRWSSE